MEKAREFQKNTYFCFIDYTEASNYVDHNKLWKIRKRWDYQTTLPPEKTVHGREATVRTGHGTTDWFKIGTGVCQGCILSSCLLDFYAVYIMQNARLDEAQAGIKTAGRSTNNLKYADNTTLKAEVKRN